jgi:tetratricopeptide (TPR) repeat protein
MDGERPEDDIMQRAKEASEEGNFAYAEFLYREAIGLDPQNVAAREKLYKLLESAERKESVFDKIKIGYHILRILVHRCFSNHDGVIAASGDVLATNPNSDFGLKSMIRAAYAAKYYKLVTFLGEKMMEGGCEVEDLLMIARSFFNENMPDRAVKISREIIAIDPENEEAKDMIWKASVERHMNSDVKLVTAGGGGFVPPKIDAEKIFIASHREKKDKNDGGKDGKGAAEKK